MIYEPVKSKAKLPSWRSHIPGQCKNQVLCGAKVTRDWAKFKQVFENPDGHYVTSCPDCMDGDRFL